MNIAKLFWSTLATMIVGAMATAFATGHGFDHGDDDEGNSHRGYAIGLWGDLPYSDLQAQTRVPNLIADMNRQDLEFTVHDGDLKVGSGVPGSVTPTTCSDAMYVQALGYLNVLRAPAMFTPGDNDWTDCDRPANGGFSSLERLEHERRLFFSTPFSFGHHRMRQEVQTDMLLAGSPDRPRASKTGGGPSAASRMRPSTSADRATTFVTPPRTSRSIPREITPTLSGCRTPSPKPWHGTLPRSC